MNAENRGVPVVGVVVNGLDRSLEDPSAPDNPALIEEMGAVPVLGVLLRAARQAAGDNDKDRAGGIAFFTFLSLFPLVLGLMAMASASMP